MLFCLRGTPIQSQQGWGYPMRSRWLDGEVLHPDLAEGYSHPLLMGNNPILIWLGGRYPLPDVVGPCPPFGLGGVSIHLSGLDGVPLHLGPGPEKSSPPPLSGLDGVPSSGTGTWPGYTPGCELIKKTENSTFPHTSDADRNKVMAQKK